MIDRASIWAHAELLSRHSSLYKRKLGADFLALLAELEQAERQRDEARQAIRQHLDKYPYGNTVDLRDVVEGHAV